MTRRLDGFDPSDPVSRAELLDRMNPEDLPSLAGFLGGYMQEDWRLGFGSAAEAAYSFIGEADLDDVEELAADWAMLVEGTRDLDLEALNRLLRERFRSGWYVTSKSEIEAVQQELEKALLE